MEPSPTADTEPVRPALDGALGGCPYCACCFVQPKAWRELGDGRLRLELLCPECRAQMLGTFEAELVARYDRSLVDGRRALCDAYEAVLRENMSAEADLLRRALDLDLICADDFTR